MELHGACLDWRRHQDRQYVAVCRECLRELVGRLDELERRLTQLERLEGVAR